MGTLTPGSGPEMGGIYMKAAQRAIFYLCWVGAVGFAIAETSGGFDYAATPGSVKPTVYPRIS